MSKRRKALTAEQVARLEKLRATLTAPNADVLLPQFVAEAARRLRTAGLPATFEELATDEPWPEKDINGYPAGRPAIARITSDRAIPKPLRDCANIVWHAADITRRTTATGDAGKAARDTFADAARLFANVLSVTLADDAPLRKIGARILKGAAKGNEAKKADALAKAATVAAEYRRVREENKKLSHSAACQRVAANLKMGRATVHRYLAEKK